MFPQKYKQDGPSRAYHIRMYEYSQLKFMTNGSFCNMVENENSHKKPTLC